MMKDNNRKLVAMSLVAGALSVPAFADTGSKAMQAHTEESESTVTRAASAAEAATVAKAFQADMIRLKSEMGMTNAKGAATASGVHSHVLDPTKMKVLMLRKNADGSFTVNHVSGAENVKEFATSAPKTTEEE